MFCPHCHNKIPDGSNICPLCYANLAGVRPQQAPTENAPAERQEHAAASSRKSSKKPAYTKGCLLYTSKGVHCAGADHEAQAAVCL